MRKSLYNHQKMLQIKNQRFTFHVPLTLSDRSRLPVLSRASLKTPTVAPSPLRLFHSANIAIPFSTTRRCSMSIFVMAPSGIPRRRPSIFQLVLRSSTRSCSNVSDTCLLFRFDGNNTAVPAAM